MVAGLLRQSKLRARLTCPPSRLPSSRLRWQYQPEHSFSDWRLKVNEQLSRNLAQVVSRGLALHRGEPLSLHRMS